MRHGIVTSVTAVLALIPSVAGAKVTDVSITPSFETAGIIITLDQDPSTAQVGVEIKGPGQSAYKKAHPFVRFDARHMATSLFELQPGASYSVKIIDGASTTTHSFTTRPPYYVPQPLKVVKVASRTELVSALDSAEPGDEIRIAPGSYTGGLTMARSGTNANPIVISGEIPQSELSKPIELRTGLPVIENAAGGDFGLLVTASHVVIQHLRVENNSGGGIQLGAASHCVIQHCQVYDNGEWFNILVQHGGAAAGYNLIQRNHVADLQHSTPFSIQTEGDTSVTYYGIRNDNSPGPGTVIRDNQIEQHYDGITPCNNEAETQDVSESATDVLAKWPNHDVEVYDNTIVDQRDDGIEADGICVNARIYRNWLGRSGSPTSISPSLPGPYFFVRNTMTDFAGSAVKFNTAKGRGTIRNIYFYHNTIARTDSSSNWQNAPLYLYDGTPSKLVTFRNNLFSGKHRCVIIQSEWTHKPDMDYDLWYTPQGPNAELFFLENAPGGWSWSDWQTNSGNEAHGVWGDPLLDGKLKITAGSPAIDKGQPIPGINDLFGGSGPDIGAVELGKPTTPADGGPVQIDGGTAGDSGQPPGDSSVTKDEAGVAGDAGADGDSDGCGCTVERRGIRPAAVGLLLLLVIGSLALLRRRSRATRS